MTESRGIGKGRGPRPNRKPLPTSKGGCKLYNDRYWYLHYGSRRNLDILLNDVKNSDMDLVIVIDGPEGLGKSFMARGLAMYCATYLGSTFGVEDIYFELDEYIDSSLKGGRAKLTGKHKINVLDEGRKVLNRARGGSSSNVKFTNYMSENRSLGQVHILLAPAFHDLDRYIVLWRMSLLFHCTKNYKIDSDSDSGVKLHRGEFFMFINNSGGKKALATCWDMKKYTYPHKWETRAIWSNKEVFTEDQVKEYELKKDEATWRKYKSEQEAKEKAKKEEEEASKTKQQYVSTSVYANIFGITTPPVVDAIREGRLKGIKQLNRWYVHVSELPQNRAEGSSETEIQEEATTGG